jgi:transglutaminase-like putative cysteine protease
LLLVPLVQAGASAPAPKSELKLPPAATYLIYLRGEKAGELKISFTRTTFEGQPAILKEMELHLKYNAGGEVEETTKSQRYLALNGALLFGKTENSSGHASRTVQARYFPDRVECEVDVNGQKSMKTVRLPAGAAAAPDNDIRRLIAKVKVGDTYRGYFFDYGSLSFNLGESEVVRREEMKSGERAIEAFLVVSGHGEGAARDWVTEDGYLLQAESAADGVKFVREDLPQPAKSASGGTDLMEAASIQTERPIEGAALVYLLKLKVSGIAGRELVLSDARQQAAVEEKEGALAVTYRMQAAFPPLRGARLVADPKGEPALQDAPYLGIEDPAIRRQAKEIAGEETDRAVVARKIHDWIFTHMKYGNAGLYRSAKEILEHQDGVCRECATLFAALARAAGIPTRLCMGIVYGNGAFYWHAWNECRLTDDAGGWYPFDATRRSDFADATHVKFTQGDVAEMYEAAQFLVGRLKVEVVEYR